MLDLTLSKNAVSSCEFVYKEHFLKNEVERSNHCQDIFAAIPKKSVLRYHSLKNAYQNKTITQQ